MNYDSLYKFNDQGVKLFEDLFSDRNCGGGEKNPVLLQPDFEVLTNPEYVDEVVNTSSFEAREFKTRIEVMDSIIQCFSTPEDAMKALKDIKLLMWLTYALVDVIIKKDGDLYKTREKAAYHPPDPDNPDWARDYRYWLFSLRLYFEFKEHSGLWLYHRPDEGPDQDGVLATIESGAANILELYNKIFFDEQKSNRVRGFQNPMRYTTKLLKQLRMTWAIALMSTDEIYEMFPAAFRKHVESLKD